MRFLGCKTNDCINFPLDYSAINITNKKNSIFKKLSDVYIALVSIAADSTSKYVKPIWVFD